MVGQICLECTCGPNGFKSCGWPDWMDEWSLSSPQPCGAPLESAPQYRHEYHNSEVKTQ